SPVPAIAAAMLRTCPNPAWHPGFWRRYHKFCCRTSAPHAARAIPNPATTGGTGFRAGQRVRHPKYGEGTVFKREGDGSDAKILVQFLKFGLKKLVEKYAQLEKA